MSSEEFTQKNNAVSENELDGVSGGILFSVPRISTAVITCPFCRSPIVTHIRGNEYECPDCGRFTL